MYKRTHIRFLGTFYNKDIGIGYYLIGNLAGSILTFIILAKRVFADHVCI